MSRSSNRLVRSSACGQTGNEGLGCAVVLSLLAVSSAHTAPAFDAHDLDVGAAGHAFDYLGNIGDQASAAVASGSTILYSSGFGLWR